MVETNRSRSQCRLLKRIFTKRDLIIISGFWFAKLYYQLAMNSTNRCLDENKISIICERLSLIFYYGNDFFFIILPWQWLHLLSLQTAAIFLSTGNRCSSSQKALFWFLPRQWLYLLPPQITGAFNILPKMAGSTSHQTEAHFGYLPRQELFM